MKMYIRKLISFIILLVILISGCSTNSPNVSRDLQEAFQQKMAMEEMNTKLSVTVDSSDNKICALDL